MFRRGSLEKDLRPLCSFLDGPVNEPVIAAASLRLAIESGVEVGNPESLGSPGNHRGHQVVAPRGWKRRESAEVERLGSVVPGRKIFGPLPHPQLAALQPFNQLDHGRRQAAEGPPGGLPAHLGSCPPVASPVAWQRKTIGEIPCVQKRLGAAGHLQTTAAQEANLPATCRPVLAQVG